VDRLACVDLPAFPLQLLLKRRPEWRGWPCAVVDRDSPQGVILWVNEGARALRILPGQRYAAGLSLSSELRADVVPRQEVEQGVERVTALMHGFTPNVEPSGDEPGVFWLDAGGLGRLFRSASRWAGAIREGLQRDELDGTVVVGFTRFGAYAVARSSARTGRGTRSGGAVVFRTAGEEEEATRAVPIERLGFEPALRDALGKLGVTRLGQFLELPAQGLLERFGEEAWRLHRMASGRLWTPLDPVEDQLPLTESMELERPEVGAERLLFVVKQLLDPLLAELERRHRAARGLCLAFGLEDGSTHEGQTIRPAEPTRDAAQLLDLVRLYLESMTLTAGVVRLDLEVEEDLAPSDQLRLWAENPRRDARAADRALARLRAELGADAIARAVLTEGHMPEACFRWEPFESLAAVRPIRVTRSVNASGFAQGERVPRAAPLDHAAKDDSFARGVDGGSRILAAGRSTEVAAEARSRSPAAERGSGWPGARRGRPAAVDGAPEARPPGRPLVRRMLRRPRPLPPRQHHLRDDGWLIRGNDHGAVSRFVGPFVVSGGWWMRAVHRDYHYAETQRGDLLWVYFDRQRRRWFLQGSVE
jgi:protein ImuB